MAAPGIEGTVDSAALIVGDWSELWFDYSSTSYPLGNVPEGTIEIGNEYYKHQGTQLPRRIDAVFLISSSMKFTGVTSRKFIGTTSHSRWVRTRLRTDLDQEVITFKSALTRLRSISHSAVVGTVHLTTR